MKRVLTVLVLFLSLVVCRSETRFVNAGVFPVYGKIEAVDGAPYERIPAGWLSDSRAALKWLGSCSAGTYIRFRSNSSSISARWSTKSTSNGNHFTDTGIRGLDLYVLTDKGWKFIGAGRPNRNDNTTQSRIIGWMDTTEKEYMMYLPLYESLTSLEIGIDEDAYIEASLADSPKRDRQIVMYGTSILQGGCASRPGMAFTNILSRKLDREVVNLGFSGNALLDLEIARFMAMAQNPAIYVLDYCPNATTEDIKNRAEEFVDILRAAHPDVPILIVDEVYYAYYDYDKAVTSTMETKFRAQKELVEKLSRKGYKKIYHMERKHALGYDDEGFVDGCHYNDLGMMRYADYLYPLLKKYMLK